MASKKSVSLFSVSEIMETTPDEELVFIVSSNPTVLESLCMFWSLELQLKKENKLTSNFIN
jgi:hypothetical protein